MKDYSFFLFHFLLTPEVTFYMSDAVIHLQRHLVITLLGGKEEYVDHKLIR